MSSGKGDSKIKWHKSGDAQWTSSVERTYTAVINFTPPGTYALTVDAVTTNYGTLRLAKNAFRHFLLNK